MKVLALPVLFLELLATLVSAVFTIGVLLFGIAGSIFALALTFGMFGAMVMIILTLIGLLT